jgi:hypothetical protein
MVSAETVATKDALLWKHFMQVKCKKDDDLRGVEEAFSK